MAAVIIREGFIQLEQIAAPATPAADKARLYIKSDNHLYLKDEAGTETDLMEAGTGVAGPVSSTDEAIAVWDGVDGDALKDTGITINTDDEISIPSGGGFLDNLKLIKGGFKGAFDHANSADRVWTFPDYDADIATLDGTETLTGKTLTTPTISATGWTNAQHQHQAANSGGTLDAAAIASGLLGMSRVASGSAGDRKVATAFSGDTSLVLRQMGAYEYQPWTVLGADSASISISSIPATHNVLVFHCTLRSDRAASTFDNLIARINGDTTAANHFGIQGTLVSSGFTGTNNLGATATIVNGAAIIPGATGTANYFAGLTIIIYNYANTSNFRTVNWSYYTAFAETAGNLVKGDGGCVWKNAANAITSLSVAPGTGTNLKAGSGYGLWLF